MPRPINYVFCRYAFHIEDEQLNAEGEFALLNDNQGAEFSHGRLREGIQPQVLCADPKVLSIPDFRSHSFEVGVIAGWRTVTQYNKETRGKTSVFQEDRHTKFGHVVTVPHLGAMAVRDRWGEDYLGASETIRALKNFVQGISSDDGELTVNHATDQDFKQAFAAWRVHEYSYTARPLNPTGTDLAKMRSEMYEREGIFQDSGRVKAAPGGALTVAGGIIEQTMDLAAGGYAQNALRGVTPEGREASITKPTFYQDKNKNLRAQENHPRFMKVAFEDKVKDELIGLDIARELVRLFGS